MSKSRADRGGGDSRVPVGRGIRGGGSNGGGSIGGGSIGGGNRSPNSRGGGGRNVSGAVENGSLGIMGDSEGDAAGKFFIGGVSWQTTEAGLREHFGKFGELRDVALMRNKHTGQPRGFGFVKFKDNYAVQKVMSQKHTLDGREVDVKPAVPRDKALSPTAGAGGGIAASPAARTVADKVRAKVIIKTVGAAETTGVAAFQSGVAGGGRNSVQSSPTQPLVPRFTMTSAASQESAALRSSHSPTTRHINRGGSRRGTVKSPNRDPPPRQGGGSTGGASGSPSFPQRPFTNSGGGGGGGGGGSDNSGNHTTSKGGNSASLDQGGGDYSNIVAASGASKASSPLKPPHSPTASDGGSSAPSTPTGSSIMKSEQARKVFVGGLAPSVTDIDFRVYFEKFGGIVDAVVMFDRQTQRSRGFGFITFDKRESVEAVFADGRVDEHQLKGKPVEVKRAEPKEHSDSPGKASEHRSRSLRGVESPGRSTSGGAGSTTGVSNSANGLRHANSPRRRSSALSSKGGIMHSSSFSSSGALTPTGIPPLRGMTRVRHLGATMSLSQSAAAATAATAATATVAAAGVASAKEAERRAKMIQKQKDDEAGLTLAQRLSRNLAMEQQQRQQQQQQQQAYLAAEASKKQQQEHQQQRQQEQQQRLRQHISDQEHFHSSNRRNGMGVVHTEPFDLGLPYQRAFELERAASPCASDEPPCPTFQQQPSPQLSSPQPQPQPPQPPPQQQQQLRMEQHRQPPSLHPINQRGEPAPQIPVDGFIHHREQQQQQMSFEQIQRFRQEQQQQEKKSLDASTDQFIPSHGMSIGHPSENVHSMLQTGMPSSPSGGALSGSAFVARSTRNGQGGTYTPLPSTGVSSFPSGAHGAALFSSKPASPHNPPSGRGGSIDLRGHCEVGEVGVGQPTSEDSAAGRPGSPGFGAFDGTGYGSGYGRRSWF